MRRSMQWGEEECSEVEVRCSSSLSLLLRHRRSVGRQSMGPGAHRSAGGSIQSPTAPVVTAAMDIPFGTKIEARHLATIQMLRGTEPAGSFHEMQGGRGQGHASGVALRRDPACRTLRRAGHRQHACRGRREEHARRDRSGRRRGGCRAASCLPGNRVDVLGSRDVGNGEAQSRRRFSQNVRVLAVDQTAATEKNEPVVVRAVTLEVTPEQAEMLVKWKEQGSLQLTLRNPLDEQRRKRSRRRRPSWRRRLFAASRRRRQSRSSAERTSTIRTPVPNHSGHVTHEQENHIRGVDCRSGIALLATICRVAVSAQETIDAAAAFEIPGASVDLSVLLFKSRIVTLDVAGRPRVGRQSGYRGHRRDSARRSCMCSARTSARRTCFLWDRDNNLLGSIERRSHS